MAIAFEHLADEATGRPIGHGDHATGPAHAREFGGDQFRARREHGSEHADDGVELAVCVRQRFGVAFFKGDRQSFGGSAGAGLLDPVGGDVAAGNFGARACGDQGELSGAAADVEQPGAGCELEPLVEQLRVLLHVARKDVVVACHPRGFQASFQLIEFGTGSCFSASRVHIVLVSFVAVGVAISWSIRPFTMRRAGG